MPKTTILDQKKYGGQLDEFIYRSTFREEKRASLIEQEKSYIKQLALMTKHNMQALESYDSSPLVPWRTFINKQIGRKDFTIAEYQTYPLADLKPMTPEQETEFLESITNLKWSNSFPRNR